MANRSVLAAMFDVRPVDASGVLDFAKIDSVKSELNLSIKSPVKEKSPRGADLGAVEKTFIAQEPSLASFISPRDIKRETLREIEATLASSLDLSGLVSAAGGKVHDVVSQGKPRYIKSVRRSIPIEESHSGIIREISRPLPAESFKDSDDVHSAAAAAPPYIGAQDPVAEFYGDQFPKYELSQVGRKYFSPEPKSYGFAPGLTSSIRRRTSYLFRMLPRKAYAGLLLTFIAGAAGVYYFSSLKTEIVAEGSAGAKNLQAAKDNLKMFDFAAAAENFSNAYQEFSVASDKMIAFSGSIGAVLEHLPGGGKLKSAKNLVEVGKLISEAGQSMTDVVKAVSKTGWVLNPQNNSRVLTGEILVPLRKALKTAVANISEASDLLDEVNLDDIPADKVNDITDLKSKIPEFRELLSDAGDYVSFFESLVAPGGTKRYLLLFQNNSELRPTGGFPGTYGVATFENGRLKNFFADDIYNADGQLKELIVPPLQLQHIVPNWGMRDANWFIDFPASAKKIMEFVPLELKYEVDGVITFNPTMMIRLLEAVGPVYVPGFDYKITAENFLETVQSEVEYGEHKKNNQPKKIVSDMAPLLLEKLYSAEKSKWLEIFNALMAGLAQKDMVMYFRDASMQEFVLKNGFGGEVKQTDDDFLMVTFSNIKGSKTDAVTDTVVRLDSHIDGGVVKHKLIITRRHNGGSEKYGFYNRQNSSFVRLLVPEGARLVGVSGNSNPYYRALLDYPKTDFTRDSELEALERTAQKTGIPGVVTMEESGKTGFGFWMLTDPKEIKTVEVEYEVPLAGGGSSEYNLYVQKQPGLKINNFELNLKPPGGSEIKEASLDLRYADGIYTAATDLVKDLPISVKFK